MNYITSFNTVSSKYLITPVNNFVITPVNDYVTTPINTFFSNLVNHQQSTDDTDESECEIPDILEIPEARHLLDIDEYITFKKAVLKPNVINVDDNEEKKEEDKKEDIFFTHLSDSDITYIEHFKKSMYYSGKSLTMSFRLFVHAFWPDFFKELYLENCCEIE